MLTGQAIGALLKQYVVGFLRECVVKRGGTTEVLYQRARERERKTGTCNRRYTGTRPSDTETRIDADTEKRERTYVYI